MLNIQNNFSQYLINSSVFDSNSALELGGAINSINSNMLFSNSIANNNSALIGGFIFYSDFIPDFLM
jgi:hypothetical protein